MTQPQGVGQNADGATPQGGGDGQGQQQQQQFTQADVDRIVGQRVAREAAKFVDYDELKVKATKLDEIEAQNASELDKAKTAAKAEGRAEAVAEADARVVRAEVKVQAAEMRFHNPALAVNLVADQIAKIKVDANGDADTAAVKALLEGLAKDNPYLVKEAEPEKGPRPPRPSPGQGARPGEKPDDRESGRAEAERRFGKKP